MTDDATSSDLLRLPEAIRRIPFRNARAKAWLKAHGLIHDVPELGLCVIWPDVLAVIRRDGKPENPEPTTETQRPRGTLPRAGVYRR